MNSVNCANCDTAVKMPLSTGLFVLEEHLCAECMKNALTLKLIITRASPTADWRLESSQPLRVSFQVPGQANADTNVSTSS